MTLNLKISQRKSEKKPMSISHAYSPSYVEIFDRKTLLVRMGLFLIQWQNRRDIARLLELEDHQLRDIGLVRYDVQTALNSKDNPSLYLEQCRVRSASFDTLR